MTLLSWMLRAMLISAFLGIAALAGERALRAVRWQTRWSWTIALLLLAVWPPISTLLARARLPVSVTALLSASPAVAHAMSANPALSPRLGQSIAILWVLASVLLALRLAHALRAIAALRARSRRAIIDGSSVLLSDAAGPATIGIRRPEVILPPVVLELDRRLRSLVLRHELEHCTRRDPLFLLLAAITLVFYPWNAPAWWIARRLAFAIELDCDARVIQAGDDRARYARLILLFAQRYAVPTVAPALATFSSQLERRILALQTPITRPRRSTLVAASVTCVVALAAACSAGLIETPARVPAPRAPADAVSDSPCPGCVEFKLDEVARPVPSSWTLNYPPAMRSAKREGEVLTRFVVQPDGTIDPSTLQVIRSSDPAFTAAVREAIPALRFTPARVGGRAVRQLLEQPFTFALSRDDVK